MRLLVGVDDREGGRDAVELARVLSAGEGSALVVNVLHTGPPLLEYATLLEVAEEPEALFAAATANLPGVLVETQAYGGGSPARILTTLAEEERFDAVVVGSPHRGPLGRVMLGSVAHSLLNGAPTDVALAAQGYAEREHGPPRVIAVGYDGGPESKRALRHAETLARRFGAKLELITVVVPALAPPVMIPSVYVGQSPPKAEQVIEQGRAAVKSGLRADSRRLDGDPASELVRASETGIDLLVLGSRGYGPVSRALLGSISRTVADRAACPVIVVRRS